MSTAEHCWGQTRYWSGSGHLLGMSLLLVTAAPYPRIGARAPSLQSVFNFRLVSGTPLAKSRAKILMQGGLMQSCLGSLPAWKIAPRVHRIRVAGMGLSQNEQWL